ncbi:MAG TPA: alpha/beta fold hydrolase [Polyangiaceae bacterium]|nr:alpha/beta fold hydrolase [Polyangiaceae bacterium]
MSSSWSEFRRAFDYSSSRLNRDLTGEEAARPLSAEGKLPTVLCFHGFGGLPLEIRLAFDEARAAGLRARAPLLPGHGERPSTLAKLRYEDWLAGAREVFDEARSQGPVILIGLSLGSLLATELYLSAPGDVLGLGILANAFWLREPMPGLALGLVQKLGLPDFGMAKFASDIGDEQARANHVSYGIQPVQAAISLRAAGQRLRDELFRVHCPTLILHGARDRVCPVANAWRVAERLGSDDVRVVVLPRSHHIITRDSESPQVARELREFIARIRTTS